MSEANAPLWLRPLFVFTFVLLIGAPLIFAVVPSARRFFIRSRTVQAISAFTGFFLLGLALPRSVALVGMSLAWVTYLLGSRRRKAWAYALWLPLSATSVLATLLWLSVINTAFSPSDGMGEGFAKFGAAVVFFYFMIAPLILLISVMTWPREPEPVRPQSIACGLSFFTGFAVVTIQQFMERL